MSDVCLSVAYIGPKSRTERPSLHISEAQDTYSTLLVGQQEGYMTCKKSGVGLLVMMI